MARNICVESFYRERAAATYPDEVVWVAMCFLQLFQISFWQCVFFVFFSRMGHVLAVLAPWDFIVGLCFFFFFLIVVLSYMNLCTVSVPKKNKKLD